MSGRSPRRRAREFALQGLYQWRVAGTEIGAVDAHMRAVAGFDRADAELYAELLRGAVREAEALEALVAPHVDRPLDMVSPVERCILLLAAYELAHHIATPYRVVLNEAIELAKSYGGTDGHRFVNGVLDKLAPRLRAAEAGAPAQS